MRVQALPPHSTVGTGSSAWQRFCGRKPSGDLQGWMQRWQYWGWAGDQFLAPHSEPRESWGTRLDSCVPRVPRPQILLGLWQAQRWQLPWPGRNTQNTTHVGPGDAQRIAFTAGRRDGRAAVASILGCGDQLWPCLDLWRKEQTGSTDSVQLPSHPRGV